MLIFLHGFLGNKRDWKPLFEYLPRQIERLAIDLPGHGQQPFYRDLIGHVKRRIDQVGARQLVGYSAGGRLALLLKDQFPSDFDRIIVLAGHPGLTHPQERALRWQQDVVWSERLRTLPFLQFLKLWYAQPIFGSLQKKEGLLHALILQRCQQNQTALASFLEEFSLGRMHAPTLYPNTLFICGEEDLKYRALYHTLPAFVKVEIMAQSGHLLPLENPKGCADAITRFLLN